MEPNWRKDDRGRWRQVPVHVTFIRRLRPGRAIDIEIRNAERDVFLILELTEEQRRGL